MSGEPLQRSFAVHKFTIKSADATRNSLWHQRLTTKLPQRGNVKVPVGLVVFKRGPKSIIYESTKSLRLTAEERSRP